tara:strand:- start:1759 stop:2019 length:261 start_codon:yes stop_codon:yes gene_type:complete
MNILLEANRLINEEAGEKEREYGPMSESMGKAAEVASILTNKKITNEDMYKCMIALKVSRLSYQTKQDTLLDICGYVAGLDKLKNK